MLWLVEAEEVADGAVVGVVAGILTGDEVLRDEVVEAAFVCAEDGVEDAADQFHTADHQAIDLVAFECAGEFGALPAVVSVFDDDC